MENSNQINLKIDDHTTEEFRFLEVRYSEAKQLFEEFKTKKKNADKKTLFELLKTIIDLVETNPKYNYYFLKYHLYEKKYISFNKLTKKNDIFTFQYNFKQLGPLLNEKDYEKLTKKKQSNPAIELGNLIELYIKDLKEFVRERKNLNYNNLNCPLIESSERARILYYKNFFST